MSEVKWIKLATDIFNNRKVKQILKMPEGDAVVVIWMELLCLAGTINEDGFMVLTRDLPYTDETLSVEFGRPLQIIRLALQTFCTLGMLELHDNIYHVTNWEKYQNADGLLKIREQNRKRQAKFKENHPKQLESGQNNVKVTLPVTVSNAIDIDIDIDKEIKNTKKKYGEFGNILLFDEEREKVSESEIENISVYVESTGKKYKSHYATILNWRRKNEPKVSQVKEKFITMEDFE